MSWEAICMPLCYEIMQIDIKKKLYSPWRMSEHILDHHNQSQVASSYHSRLHGAHLTSYRRFTPHGARPGQFIQTPCAAEFWRTAQGICKTRPLSTTETGIVMVVKNKPSSARIQNFIAHVASAVNSDSAPAKLGDWGGWASNIDVTWRIFFDVRCDETLTHLLII